MVDVDTIELKNYIDSLNSLIEEYEEIKLNLFNQLNNSFMNWQDGNSLVFESKIFEEKQEASLILTSLKNKKDVFSLIYNKYVEIGKQIKCNLDNKESLIRNIDGVINETNSVINSFNGVDMGYFGGDIMAAKNKIVAAKGKLIEVKDSVSKMYNRIEEMERLINNKIKELEVVKINSFDFNLV